MTNTSLRPGPHAPEEILRSIKRGVYAVRFSGGQVNISNGDFVFSLTESYLIEDGKITAPLKGVNLIGNGPEVLNHVDDAGQRLRAVRRHLDLRQGGAVGPGRGRHAHGQDRPHHGGRDQSVSGARNKDIVGELREQAQRVVQLARKAGADEAEVQVSDGTELTAKVRLGQPELVQEAGSRGLGLRVFRDRRQSVTFTSDLRPHALERFATDAVALARLSEPDELHRLPEPDQLAVELPDLDLYDPGSEALDAAEALARAQRGEKAALAHDKRVTNSEGASYSRVLGAMAFATLGRVRRRLSGQLLVADGRAGVRRRGRQEAQRLLVDRGALRLGARGAGGGGRGGGAPHRGPARLAQGRHLRGAGGVRPGGGQGDRRHGVLGGQRLVVLPQELAT